MASRQRRVRGTREAPLSDADRCRLETEWEAVLSKEGLGERGPRKQIRGARGTPGRAHAKSREFLVKGGRDADPDEILSMLADHNAVRRPESDLEAIMSAAPHESPDRSLDASYGLRERLLDAMEDLDDTDREIVSQVVFGQESHAQVARNLGFKTHSPITRRLEKALNQLAVILDDDPEIIDYLEGKI